MGGSRIRGPKTNLVGVRFGRLVVTGLSHREVGGFYIWNCNCDCGGVSRVSTSNLSNGSTNSCGCLEYELSVERKTTHGMAGTRFYKIYLKVVRRCTNPDDHSYDTYGGRGITV